MVHRPDAASRPALSLRCCWALSGIDRCLCDRFADGIIFSNAYCVVIPKLDCIAVSIVKFVKHREHHAERVRFTITVGHAEPIAVTERDLCTDTEHVWDDFSGAYCVVVPNPC